jgi:hypothetical protein
MNTITMFMRDYLRPQEITVKERKKKQLKSNKNRSKGS